MLERRRGDLVFVGSENAVRPRPYQAAYTAAKAGLEGLARVLAMELDGTGVRSIVVRVGPTGSEFGARMDHAHAEAGARGLDATGACSATCTSCPRRASRRRSPAIVAAPVEESYPSLDRSHARRTQEGIHASRTERRDPMALAPLNPETRNLIDGKLVGASNGATFENVNPATEEVIGVCADGTKDDMNAAIAAARRAFDETDWSTNAAFRKRCLDAARRGAQGGEGGAARDRRRRGGLAGAAHLRGAVRHLHRRDALLGGARRQLRRTSGRCATSRSWASRSGACCAARRPASSARSRPGTSRST